MALLPAVDARAYALFVGAAAALILTPGPDTVFVLTQGVTSGTRGGVAAALGVASGVLVHTTAASLGLAALLRASALAFTAVKYAGALYLAYLGVRTLRAGGDLDALAGATDGPRERAAPDLRRGYRRGLVVNVLNPKVALFFLALLPQFVDSGPGATAGMVALGVTYAALTALYLGAVGALSGHVRAAFRGRPRLADGLRWASGTVLVGLGAALVLESA